MITTKLTLPHAAIILPAGLASVYLSQHLQIQRILTTDEARLLGNIQGRQNGYTYSQKYSKNFQTVSLLLI